MSGPILLLRPRFLLLDDALSMHDASISAFGGIPGIRDLGALESALAMPRQAFGNTFAHDYPFGMAAAYGFHVARNHPFLDGNKRTAFSACFTFLHQNGWLLTADEDEAADQIVAVAEGKLPKDRLAEWLERNSRPRPSIELRDFFDAVSVEQVASLIEAWLASPGEHERVASVEEAASVIPLIGDLREISSMLHQRGDERQASETEYAAMVLVALFRIAEDLGYEW